MKWRYLTIVTAILSVILFGYVLQSEFIFHIFTRLPDYIAGVFLILFMMVSVVGLFFLNVYIFIKLSDLEEWKRKEK